MIATNTKRLLHLVVLCFAGVLMSVRVSAQEMIDENFIELLSQNAKEVLAENDADFTTTTVPGKWADESLVMLGYRKHILFDKKRSGLMGGKEHLVLIEKKRVRIKLLDKTAVEKFSELYFRYSSKFDGFTAIVYKPDGSKREIPLTKAVGIEDNDNVPEFFQSFFDQNVRNRHEYYKVPVADLLPGDLLEFGSITSSTLNVRKTPYYQFDPQYELCQKGMPVMRHKIVIETDNNSFVTARSVNGAPEFKQSSNGEFNVYTWEDGDRERLKDVNFVNEFMVLPSVKFQITYTDGREIKYLFAGTKGQIKTTFDMEEIGKKAYANYAGVGSSYVYGSNGTTVDAVSTALWNQLKKAGGKDVPEDRFIEMAYYYIRHTQVFNNYEYSHKQFCYLMGQLLYTRKIPSEIIVTTPNNLTTPANLLFEDELVWCLKVKDKYIFRSTEHSNLYDVNEVMLGNIAYRIPVTKAEKTEETKILDVEAKQNRAMVQYNVVVDTSFKWLNIERTSSYIGIQRARNSGFAMHLTTYMFNDSRTFNGPDDYENIPSKYMDKIYQQKKMITDEFKTRKPEYMKDQMEDDLGVTVKYKNFHMVNEGRSFKKQELVFKEEAQVGEKIRKAGKKLLVNLPGLMGGQLQIRKEERDRHFDIDVRYPRDLQWQINMTIPAGYAVEGVEDLNTSVDNETGSFITTAKVENNILTIEVKKSYKQKNISKDKWPQMLAFVDAAYNFTHKNILLKPTN